MALISGTKKVSWRLAAQIFSQAWLACSHKAFFQCGCQVGPLTCTCYLLSAKAGSLSLCNAAQSQE